MLHVYSSARASPVDLNGKKALAQEALRLLAVIAQWMNVNLHHITDLRMEKKKPKKTQSLWKFIYRDKFHHVNAL